VLRGAEATAIVEATFEVAPVAALVAQASPCGQLGSNNSLHCVEDFRTNRLHFQCEVLQSLNQSGSILISHKI